jgi:hypothetical protein
MKFLAGKKRRWLFGVTALNLFVGIFVVLSVVFLGIMNRGAITQESCDRIKVGMTYKEVTEVLGGRKPQGHDTLTTVDIYFSDNWSNRSALYVRYCDGVVAETAFRELQVTQWDLLKWKARNAYDRMVSLF